MAKVVAKQLKSIKDLPAEVAGNAKNLATNQIQTPPMKLKLKRMFSSKLADTDRQFFKKTYNDSLQKKIKDLDKPGGEWETAFRNSKNPPITGQIDGNLKQELTDFKKVEKDKFIDENELNDTQLRKLYNESQDAKIKELEGDAKGRELAGRSWFSKNKKTTGLAVVMGATGATALATGQSFKDASKDVTDTLRDAAEPAVQVSAEIATQTAVIATDIAAVGAETIVDNSAGLIGTIAEGTGSILSTFGISGDFGIGNTFSMIYYLIGAFVIFYIFRSMTKAGDAQVDSLIYG
tara:strand:- start:995 stop:1873 length:879 start_codon:yes stop_codon:yes gene_type:complete